MQYGGRPAPWLAIVVAACSGLGPGTGCKNGGGDDGSVCEPGSQAPCTCPDGEAGVAPCSPSGEFFGPCQCGASTGVSTEGTSTDASTSAASATTCAGGDCTSGSDGATTGGPDCPGQPVYAGMIADQPALWSFMALEGYGAGLFMCQDMGFDHPCDYEEILAAEAASELAALPAATTAWLHRTTTVTVNMIESEPGAGGRCADWTITDDTLADGEFIEIGAGGAVTYNFDDDTFYDGADTTHVQDGLPCGAITRAILCCHACE